MFRLPECYSKCPFYHEAIGPRFKKQLNDIRWQIFPTNVLFNQGNKYCIHFNKYIHGNAGKRLKLKCKTDPKLIWPNLFKRFIDDGFGITKETRKDVIYWIENFNELRKTNQIDKI